MANIDILLAAYSPDETFEQQLQSILVQTNNCWQLYVRDDNQANDVEVILSQYNQNQTADITNFIDGKGRLGTAKNFSCLLEHAASDYVMFCDQDDVWLPYKVDATLEKMLQLEKTYGKQTPLLVHTDSTVVDKDLKLISESLWAHQNIQPKNREVFNRLLVQNIVTGCTVMINKALRDFAMPVPESAIMHDWWLALVASAFGKIGHVDQQTMLYRQHQSNAIGAKNWNIPFVVKNMFGNHGRVREGIENAQKQSRVFLERYASQLPDDIRMAVECYATLKEKPYLEKIYLLLKYRLFKAGMIRNLGFWVHI